MEGKSAAPAMSPKPGSLSPVPSLPAPLPPASDPGASAPLPVPAVSLPADPEPGIAPPEGAGLLGLALPGLDELEPALPDELERLDPEPPLLALGELGPAAPPEGGEDAPELEGDEGGVGSEGVVGVLAEGQPINTSMMLTIAPAANGRNRADASACKRGRVFIRAAVPSHPCRQGSNQRTTQSYQSPLLCPPRSEV